MTHNNGSTFFEQQAKKGEETEKNFYTFLELWKYKDHKQEFLIDDLFPKGNISAILGEDGIGKTQFCIQLCLSVALGNDQFLGQKLNTTSNAALMVNTEEGKEKFLSSTQKQIHAAEGKNFEPTGKRPLLDFLDAGDCKDFTDFTEQLKAKLIAYKYDVVIIDSFQDVVTSLLDGEINNSGDVNKVLHPLQRMAERHNTTMILIHHVAKTKIDFRRKTNGDFWIEKNDSLGSSRFTSKLRAVFGLSHDRKSISADGKSYTNYFHVLKNNLMTNNFKVNAFQLHYNTETLTHEFEQFVNIEELRENEDAKEQANSYGKSGQKLKPEEIDIKNHLMKVDRIFGSKPNLTEADFKKKFCKSYDVPLRNFNRSPYNFYGYLKNENIIVRTTTGHILKGLRFKDYDPPF